MTPILEGTVLGTDLDGQSFSLLNVKSLDPVPLNLATSDDVRLSDVREPAPGQSPMHRWLLVRPSTRASST